jgi:UDPglucose 6-dehydrogenase
MVASRNYPVFFGLSHMGQVFSLCWSKKIGTCYVFDVDKKKIEKLKNRQFTNEEPSLKKIKTKKIKYLNKIDDIAKFKYIFFTFDTPLNLKDGKPEPKLINQNLKKIINLDFKLKSYLIISSQLSPDFLKNFLRTNLINKNLKIFYLVDSLKMGEAINRFLKPEQIILGGEIEEKNEILKIFKKFDCKKIFLKLEEAIITKMAINIYLSFSVTFANIFDDICRQYNSNFSNILPALKNDKRIGDEAYINPSLGFSGGHLERDLFFLKNKTYNIQIKKIIQEILNFNNKVINKINSIKIGNQTKNINTLVIGKSYKKDSFSFVNSVFTKLNKKFKLTFFDDIFEDKKYNKYKLKKLIYKNKLIIYNYSTERTMKNLINLSKTLNVKVINISKKKINTKINKNFINFF